MGKRYNQPPRAEGENRKILQEALASWELPMIDIKDAMAVEQRISDYLKFCMEHDAPPSVSGCANWLRVAVSTLEGWRAGRKGSPEHQRIAAAFYGTMEEIWARDMHDGNINPVSGIFTGKVFFGYRETQEVVVQHQNQLEISAADLIAQSKMLPGAERLSLPSTENIIDAEVTEVERPETPQKEIVEYHGETFEIDTPPILEDLKYVDDPHYESAVKKKP